MIPHDLRPPSLDTFGLHTTMDAYCREFARRTGLVVDYAGNLPTDPPTAVSISLYRCVQESLTNVAKHASAKHVRVRAQHAETQITLSVADEGRGFASDGRAPSEGIGFSGMRERIELMGGVLKVTSLSGAGTEVIARVPSRRTV